MPSSSAETTTIDNARRTSAWRAAAWFVLVAFVLSWVPWLTLLATTADPSAGPASMALWITGGYGPPAAAVVVVAAGSGRAGLRRLLQGLRAWRLGAWYLVLLLPVPVVVAAVLYMVATGQAALELAGVGHWLALPAMLLGGVLLGGFEEVGWRGYLLPRLQDRIGALTASIVIGVVWAAWHAPLFLLETTSQAAFSPLWFTWQAVAMSVLLTWMYNGTGGSVLLAVLFHGVTNGWYSAVVAGVAPEALAGFLAPVAVLLTLVGAWLVLRHGPGDLSARPRRGWHGQLADAASTPER